MVLVSHLSFIGDLHRTDVPSSQYRERIYQSQVFFIEHLGFCQPSLARRITFEESLLFERIHEATYHSLGYELIKIATDALAERVQHILAWTREALENP